MIPLHSAAVSPPSDTGWRWQRALSAPHRLGFLVGGIAMGLSALWWLGVLLSPTLGWQLPWAVAPGIAHGLWMSAGFMPMFIVGFLFTAGPKWLGMPEVAAPTLWPPVRQFALGWVVAVLGFHAHVALASAGLAWVMVAWWRLTYRFIGLIRLSPATDRLHAQSVALACALGGLALGVALLGLLAQDAALQRAAVHALVWAFLAPCFTVVAHRMVPFFTAAALPALDAWRPRWLLLAMTGVLALGAVDAVAAAFAVGLPTPLRWGLAGVEAVAGVLLLALAIRWGLVQSWRNRLLAMLHGGFVWLGVALLLQGVSHALVAMGQSSLGLAPLHALTMGYLGCTLIAMITRVAAGHSGRPLAVDGVMWALYGVLQVAVVLRVLQGVAGWQGLLPLAALAWATVTVCWAWRYGQWLGRPRADGRPG